MVASSADEAVNNARRSVTCAPGMCLMYTRTWLEIPSGSYSAADAWHDSQHKHRGDISPPKGVPIMWTGGSRGFGHIGLSVGHGRFRGTDMPYTGGVSEQSILWVGQHWGQKYEGWTEDLNGILIPYVNNAKPEPSKYARGEVLVAKLHKGQKNSDSVGRLCYRLAHHAKIPGSHKPKKQTDNYNTDIVEAVRYWQRNVRPNIAGPSSGESLSNKQANVLFGNNYNVVEE
jgi:hypothetical protein